MWDHGSHCQTITIAVENLSENLQVSKENNKQQSGQFADFLGLMYHLVFPVFHQELQQLEGVKGDMTAVTGDQLKCIIT